MRENDIKQKMTAGLRRKTDGMMRFSADNEDDKPMHQNERCKAWFGDPEDVRLHHECAPGRILALVSKLNPKEISTPSEEIWAITATCEFKHKASSLFTTEWETAWMCQQSRTGIKRKMQRLELVNPCNFVDHCLMIPEDETNEKFHQVWNPELWADVHHQDE